VGVAVVSAVLALESVALLAVGVWLAVALATGASASPASAIFLMVLILAFGAGLAAVAWNLYAGFRWTRSAAFVWQLLMLAIAVPSLLAGAVLTGLVLLVPALVVLVLLFVPSVVAATLRTRGAPPVL
jgi:hypothetical protein